MSSKLVTIDGTDYNVSYGITLADITPADRIPGQVITRRDKRGFEVLKYEEVKREQLAEFKGITRLQSDLTKGSYSTRDLLTRDLAHMQNFFAGIARHPEGMPVTVFPNCDKPQYIILRNFPLPDKKGAKYKPAHPDKKGAKYKPAHEHHILIVIGEYPEDGPRGVHILKQSTNLEKIREALEGHVGPSEHVQANRLGYSVVCFHYRKTWQFNPANIRAGDCLSNYVEAMYAALSGGFHA